MGQVFGDDTRNYSRRLRRNGRPSFKKWLTEIANWRKGCFPQGLG
jgi:hypothetical protein